MHTSYCRNFSKLAFVLAILALSSNAKVLSREPWEPQDASAMQPYTRPNVDITNRFGGNVEAQLTNSILNFFAIEDSSAERLAQLRQILGGRWSTNSVEKLGQVLLAGTPLDGEIEILDVQWAAVTDLLVYKATTGTDTQLFQRTIAMFDQLYAHAYLLGKKKIKSCYFGCMNDSVECFGTAAFLTDSFWATQRSEMMPSRRVLEKIGDRNTIEKLKTLRNAPAWSGDQKKRFLEEYILHIEMLLKYPELRQIRNEGLRWSMGDELFYPVYGPVNAAYVKKLADGCVDVDSPAGPIYLAIAQRLKAEENAAKQPK